MKPFATKIGLPAFTQCRTAVFGGHLLKRLLLLCALVLACAAFPALAQSPPALNIDYSSGTQVRLSWADTPGIIVLEEADTLAPTSVWRPSPQVPILLNGQFSVMVDGNRGRRFFRLHKIETGGLPPDPASIAPPVAQGVATVLAGATEFLYTGPNAIQTGVAPGTIDARRGAVVRGKVINRDNTPLSGVTITILNHSELGQTVSRADGMFDLAVNGGGLLTVKYEKTDFCPVQRQINVPWQDYVMVQDAVMIRMDPIVTPVAMGINSPMQMHQGSMQTDADGARRATILFMPGTSANLVLANGATQSVSSLNIRATEFSVGTNGPAAMPAKLPPSSGYTYCVEFSADEALAAGATDVRFSQPLPVYVENFLGFPVGTAVPTGYYDRQKGQWIASANGRVIKVLSITGGLADLDTDGDTVADDATKLATLGVADEERARLAQLYTPGNTLWRVPITHFTPWDFNWPFGPPTNAIPPPARRRGIPPVDDPNCDHGSIIGSENQSLGESVSVSGTPFMLHYQSERTPGRKDVSTVNIPVSGEIVPASLKRIELEISVAGRRFTQNFPASPNQSYAFTWDGHDAYGRTLHGAQPVAVNIGYVYGGVYLQPSEIPGNGYDALFGHFSYYGTPVSGNRERLEVTLRQEYDMQVESSDNRSLGLGGWSLSIHHLYDARVQTLILGDGRQRRAEALSSIIHTVAGNGDNLFSGDGGPATAAGLNALDVAVGPDGSLFIAESLRIRRVGPDGIITTVAGNGIHAFSGDGGPATAASLHANVVALGPDGSLFINDGVTRIRRVGPDGIITTVAGNGIQGFSGDGGPATAASLDFPISITVGPDGSLFIADGNNSRVRRVGPDGIITTVAGNGKIGESGDGGRATAAAIGVPVSVALGPDGSLYIAEGYRIRRVRPDGIINTVAGNGIAGSSGDGGPATAASVYPSDVAVGLDGSLFIYDGARIRRVRPDGIITTVAGNGVTFGEIFEGSPATATSITIASIALGPHGSLFYSEYGGRVRSVRPALPEFSVLNTVLPSEDGREVYIFDSSGRHLNTFDALSGAVRYQFGYDSSGYLTSITDGSSNVTTIERSGAVPTAIKAPDGQRTALTVSAEGWLVAVTNPAAERHTMSYSADGLLQRFIDPLTNIHSFTYDALGRLIKDEDPAGGSTSLARTEQTNGYTVTTTSALGRSRVYQVEQLSTGAIRRSVTQPSGVKTVRVINTDASEQTTNSDGSVTTVQYGPDPRWGMLAPIATGVTVQNAGGLTQTIMTTHTTTLSDPLNLLSVSNATTTVTLNNRTFTTVYDVATRTATSTSAAGRQGKAAIDSLGRIVQSEIVGLLTTDLTYDTRGRLASVTQGTGADARIVNFSYNPGGYLDTVTDPLGRTLRLAYDAAGRLTRQDLPDGRAINYGYDASGNLTFITPPGRPTHRFSYTPVDLQSEYIPPDVGAGSNSTRYTYDRDRQLTRITRPDGQILDLGYDSAGGCSCGRLSTLTLPTGVVSFSYDDATGKLTGITTPDGDTLSYSYTGALHTQTSWAGTVAGSVGRTYDNDFRVTSLSLNDTNAIAFQYDRDGLLTTAGNLILSRNAQNGLLTATTLGNVTDSFGYDDFGEVTNYSASYSGSEIFKILFSYDKVGRITTKTETVEGTAALFEYSYDLAGRLTEVKKDGTVTATYSYDSNGNRLTAPGLGAAPIYDDQDRLMQYGGTTYSYSANGELKTKTIGALVTSYAYDLLGNLKQVALPGGTVIDYVIDGRNRRSGKKVIGVLVQGFLYQDGLKPIVELDSANNVVSRFVYATGVNVPDYMIKRGVTYRILTDHLGSPRMVIDVATGAVVQQMDYDQFGNVIADSNPGFQPFGFAGGLYDSDTKLVRFGARDYDSESGRWTAKDTIGFSGGDINLYNYAANSPDNVADPSGLYLRWVDPIFAPYLEMLQGTSTGRNLLTAIAGNPTPVDILNRDLQTEVVPTRGGRARPCDGSIEITVDANTINSSIIQGMNHRAEITSVLGHELQHARQMGELGIDPAAVDHGPFETEAYAVDRMIRDNLTRNHITYPDIDVP